MSASTLILTAIVAIAIVTIVAIVFRQPLVLRMLGAKLTVGDTDRQRAIRSDHQDKPNQ